MARPSRKNMDADTPSARDQLLDATGALMTEQRTIDISLAEIAERSSLNSAPRTVCWSNCCARCWARAWPSWSR